MLVVNTTFDPATPYHGAKKVNKLLRNSRLLTLNGWGHTSLFLSACADNIVADYLLTGNLPEKGSSCDVDVVPFSTSSAVEYSGDMQRRSGGAKNSDDEREELRKTVLKGMLPYHLH